MKVLSWVSVITAISVIGYLGLGFIMALRLTAPIRQPVEWTPTDVGLDYQEVSLQSDDGLTLSAWWIGKADSSRAAVLVHGWGGDKSEQPIVETALVYNRAGFSVLMLDLRGHGESEGGRITAGDREVYDVQAALSWLAAQGFDPGDIVLHGWSMGGATVVRAAPRTGVAAVVEESAYADLPSLLQDRLPEASGLPAFFNPGIFLMGKLFLGIDPWAVRPEEEARQLSEEGVPFLIIHSRDDEVVPFEHAEAFAAAHPQAELWEIKGYQHVAAYTHPEYQQRLTDFLDRAMAHSSKRRQTGGS